MKEFLAVALLLLVTVLWGWTFTIVKDAVAVYGVVSFLAIRFVIGSTALGVFSLRRLKRDSLKVGACIGIALALGHLLQTVGLHYTTPTNCGLITGLFVVLGPVANRILFGVKVRQIFWATIAASLGGLVLLSGAEPSQLRVGDLLTLVSAVCYGLHVALLDRYAKGHDAVALALAQTCSASVIFLVAWPLSAPLEWPPGDVWFALVITGVFATAAAFYIQTYVQQRLTAVRTAIILTAEPVFAAIFGYVLAGDRLTGVQIAGAVVMVGAMAFGQLTESSYRS